MNNSSNFSNASSDYEANGETLDQLYKDQLQALRQLILKQNVSYDIDLCQKWLKVFGNTSKNEKIARNCLCSLMQQQLQDFGCLGEPFTDLQNCNRDLECVLKELDGQSFITEQTATLETFTSHRKQELCVYNRSGDGGGVDGNVGPNDECFNNETQTENVLLRRELESLRLHLTEKQIENAKLREIIEKVELENTKNAEGLTNFKNIVLKAIKTTLKNIENEEDNFSIKVFTSIFNDFSADENFFSHIKKYDSNLQLILSKKFEKEFNKRKSLLSSQISEKLTKSKVKLREKYNNRMRLQGWAQRLQLKLVKLKCFSVLRNIFITTQGEHKETMWELLKVLEEKYQGIVNEIL